MAEIDLTKSWSLRARRYLKRKLKEKEITYPVLAELMQTQKLYDDRTTRETAQSIAHKLSRGTFSASFFLAVLAAIGVEQVQLKHV